LSARLPTTATVRNSAADGFRTIDHLIN
jgi:hypothetical protein